MRQAIITLAVIGSVAATTRTAEAVHMTQEQSFTANAAGYWQALFYEYTYSTTSVSEVQYGRTSVAAPWLLYTSWYGLFLYDYTSGRFEEGFYYSNARL